MDSICIEQQEQELLQGEALEESRLDQLSRKMWDWNKGPSSELIPISKPPKYPMVLCHGIGGSKPLLPYFHSIAEDLEEAGCKAFRWRVERYSSIETRAKSLKKKVDWYLSNNPEVMKLNLIAHSMGGLDCRYYISSLGGHKYVSSLTTIGTPHRGTSWADLYVKQFIIVF